MKLKKIASLALAGIMAVSMLAGCGEGISNSGSSSSENTSTASGYSKVLADNLSDDVTDKKYVTFQDNAQDEAALRQSLNNLNTEALKNSSEGHVLECIYNYAKNGYPEMIADFTDAAGFTDKDLKIGDLKMEWYASSNYINRTVKDGTVFVIDGVVGTNEAVKRVAAQVEDYLEMLPEHNSQKVGGNSNVNNDVYDYEYTVSVSVVNKAVNAVNWSNASVTFIAVTVTRTATAD